MKIRLFLALCCVLYWSEGVRADADNEIKRGLFPFMAVVYYPDETVVDSTGARFQRAAVLIRPKWLVSAAIDHSVLDNVPLGFPRKTLLARAGAVSIDSNYTLNEDEHEQEREVVQIVRPSIHNQDVWWISDITLLQTLLPFTITSAVAATTIIPRRDYQDKNCNILVYAKRYGNFTEDKLLMQLGVELMPPSAANCGNQFSDSTMTCAVDNDETKTAVFDPDFCQGNSGGPLMCEGEVMALQTYIENKCKQPHLYQLLASWDGFITCGIEERCNKDQNCSKMCVTVNKDSQPDDIQYSEAQTTMPPMVTETTSTTRATTEVTYDETETVPATTSPETEATQFEVTRTTLQTGRRMEPETSTEPETSSELETSTEPETSLELETSTKMKTETTEKASTIRQIMTMLAHTETKSWPIEKATSQLSESARKMMPSEEVDQKTHLEAQVKSATSELVQSSASSTHMVQLTLIPLVVFTHFA